MPNEYPHGYGFRFTLDSKEKISEEELNDIQRAMTVSLNTRLVELDRYGTTDISEDYACELINGCEEETLPVKFDRAVVLDEVMSIPVWLLFVFSVLSALCGTALVMASSNTIGAIQFVLSGMFIMSAIGRLSFKKYLKSLAEYEKGYHQEEDYDILEEDEDICPRCYTDMSDDPMWCKNCGYKK